MTAPARFAFPILLAAFDPAWAVSADPKSSPENVGRRGGRPATTRGVYGFEGTIEVVRGRMPTPIRSTTSRR